MSRILEQLEQAEAQHERLITGSKRLGAEAPAARTSPTPAPAAQTPQQQSRLAAGVAIAVAMAVVFWVGTLVSRPPSPAPVAAARAPEIPPRAAPELFKIDRDVDAFVARLREKGLE